MRFTEIFFPPAPPGAESNPARMKGNEPLQGAAVAVVLVVVGILDLAINTGAGAPKHPSSALEPIGGIVLAVLLAGSLRFRNRLLSPFMAILSSFFVTLAKGPSVLSTPHIAALVVAVGFAVSVSLRQRREQKGMSPAQGAAQRRAAADARRRRRKGEPEPPPTSNRPPPSARYTPPKPKTIPKR